MKKISIIAALFIVAFNFQTKAQNLKGDPWIFQVYQEIYHRQPNAWELNINNYNSGSWNNYNELKGYVKEFQDNLKRNNINIGFTKVDDNRLKVGFTMDNQLAGTAVIATNGGGVITSGGPNVIAAGGANVITIGCCNFQLTSSTKAVGRGGGTIVAASGKGALIFQCETYKSLLTKKVIFSDGFFHPNQSTTLEKTTKNERSLMRQGRAII